MGMSQLVIIIMMGFMALGALDRIMDQLGGAENVLGCIGLKRLGSGITGAGTEFEEGFNAMGPLGLGMIGIVAFAPVIANLLGNGIGAIYSFVGASPAMFAGTVLACDTGGYPLALKLAQGDLAAGMYSGVLLGSTMGATIVFIIPVGIGLIPKDDIQEMAKGILSGLATIPLACVAGGIFAMATGVEIDGQPVNFTLSMLLKNMIPVTIFALVIILGLLFKPGLLVKCFQIFSKFLVILITTALACAILEDQLGIVIIAGMDPIFSVGDGELKAVEIVGKIGCMLLGAYPMVFFLRKWFRKPLFALGQLLHMNDASAAGLLASFANVIPMFGMVHKMDKQGKILNMAFAVSGGFVFGDHLGFIAAVAAPMIAPMIVTKLVGGFTAIMVAILIIKKDQSHSTSPTTP